MCLAALERARVRAVFLTLSIQHGRFLHTTVLHRVFKWQEEQCYNLKAHQRRVQWIVPLLAPQFVVSVQRCSLCHQLPPFLSPELVGSAKKHGVYYRTVFLLS